MPLLKSIRALLALPDRVGTGLRDVERSIRSVTKASEEDAKKSRAAAGALREEMAALRDEVHDRLLQYHLQLARLAAVVDGGKNGSHGTVVPANPSIEGDGDATFEELPAHGTADEWLALAACPACGTVSRTIVCEWNKLILLDSAPDQQAPRYEYAVCHGCGILYATQRPVGSRYRYLVEHFEDVLDKNAKNPLLNPHPLTDADREQYRELIARGVFVSDHVGGEYLKGVFGDRVENAGHIEILGSLLDLRKARVLEIRPRAGTILDGLRRYYGAEVYGIPLWESQKFILQELYGIPTSALLDFDRFSIPFDPPFDLIVCNHMFNHAVRLDDFLKKVHGALREGGHLYLYNEIDDSEFLQGGQSMIATMNPLHLQAADRRSLVRALCAAGFAPVFVKGRDKRNFCLMRKVARPEWEPVSSHVLEKRVRSYQRARDRAVLKAPERLRRRFADVWPATVERAVVSGVAQFDEAGRLRIVKE